jgi:hypothetical protein
MTQPALQTTPVQPPLKLADIRAAQNFPLALLAGSGAAALGAIGWVVVTVASKSEWGLMSVVIGYLVGKTIRKTGKGVDHRFGLLGAALAGTGAVLGNIGSNAIFLAGAQNILWQDFLRHIDPAVLQSAAGYAFRPMDLVFYAIAIYEGYVLSFKYRMAKPAISSGKISK